MDGPEHAAEAVDCYNKNKALHLYQMDTKLIPAFIKPSAHPPRHTSSAKDTRQSLKTAEQTITESKVNPSKEGAPRKRGPDPAGSAHLQERKKGQKIEDRLMMQWASSEQKKEALRRSEHLRRDPQISEYSKTIARVGSVHERYAPVTRLYSLKDKSKHPPEAWSGWPTKQEQERRAAQTAKPATKPGGADLRQHQSAASLHSPQKPARANSSASSRVFLPSGDSRQLQAKDSLFQRGMVWLQKKNAELSKLRGQRVTLERAECTFRPITHEFVKEELPPLELLTMTSEPECRMVFDGKTYDLAKMKEFHLFFKQTTSQRTKRSIFKRLHDFSQLTSQQLN